MAVRFSDAWTFHGLQALVLENELLRVTVLPQLGGKIWSIISKYHDREMLWHHPRMHPRVAPFGSLYDNWFCGGWDDIFPNDFPVEMDGEAWPDHGEVWSLPSAWRVKHSSPNEVEIVLEHRGIIIPTRFQKRIRLVSGERSLHIDYLLANEGSTPVSVHWKSHPALPLEVGARLHLPAKHIVDEPGFGEVYETSRFAWPDAPRQGGGSRDLRALPDPASGDVLFYYGVDLTDGYAAVSYPKSGLGFGLTFDRQVQNSVWIFASAGGWRNLNVVIPEPCTGYHADLSVAQAKGTLLRLDPSQEVRATMGAHILLDMEHILAFEASGGTSI